MRYTNEKKRNTSLVFYPTAASSERTLVIFFPQLLPPDARCARFQTSGKRHGNLRTSRSTGTSSSSSSVSIQIGRHRRSLPSAYFWRGTRDEYRQNQWSPVRQTVLLGPPLASSRRIADTLRLALERRPASRRTAGAIAGPRPSVPGFQARGPRRPVASLGAGPADRWTIV